MHPKFLSLLPAACAALLCSAALRGSASAADDNAEYKIVREFKIGGEGTWDYLIVDSANKLLYSPRTGHTTVVNAKTGELAADIPGVKHGHGVALVPSIGRGFISDGDGGLVQIFDLKTFKVLGTIKTIADSDGIIYDSASNKVLVVSGDGNCVIPISPDLDPENGKADEQIALGGKPEYLVSDGHGKVFINLTDKGLVAVLDTSTMKVVDRWSTAPGGFPVAMAYDSGHRRLILGCRNPQKMIIMSADDGKVISSVPIGEGADATAYDPDGSYAFASCRDGTLVVARETSEGHFEMVQTVKTLPWAGTCGLDPETHELYLPTGRFAQKQNFKKHGDALSGSYEIIVVGRAQ